MSLQPERHYSVDDYFVAEESSPLKHEYYRGEIFAMAGALVAHNDISANVLTALRVALRGKGCRAFGSDLRIKTPGGLYTYPDVSVICGRVKLVAGRPDTATNPVLLVEVLSDATRDYDRGEKFALYKAIPTLREYLVIEQAEVSVEHFARKRGTKWSSRLFTSLESAVPLGAADIRLGLADVYREVFA
jgi:Uma2 family endonuclease